MSIFVNAPFVPINKLGVLGIATFFFLTFEWTPPLPGPSSSMKMEDRLMCRISNPSSKKKCYYGKTDRIIRKS